MNKILQRVSFPNRSHSERGAAYIETVIVVIPCLVALATFFTTGLLAAFMGEALSIVVIDAEMVKAAEDGQDDMYAKFAVDIGNLAIGHPDNAKDEAIADLKANIDENDNEHLALVNFFAGAKKGRFAVGFANNNDYLQATVGMQNLDSETRLIWNAYKVWNPLGALPGQEDYITITAGAVRRAAADLDISSMMSAQLERGGIQAAIPQQQGPVMMGDGP